MIFVRVQTNEVAYVLVGDLGKSGSACLAFIFRAEQDFWCNEFVRHCFVVTKHLRRIDKLQGSSELIRDGKCKPLVVIISIYTMGQADLFKLANAANPWGAKFATRHPGQSHRGQKSDRGDNQHHLNDGKCPPSVDRGCRLPFSSHGMAKRT